MDLDGAFEIALELSTYHANEKHTTFRRKSEANFFERA